MRYRKLGIVGPTVSAIGMGCFNFTGSYGAVTEAQSRKTMTRAVDLGITLFDTAAAYGNGDNERFVGSVLRPLREKVVLVTKCGLGASGGAEAGAAPEAIRGMCDDSLQRLGFDEIDLYLAHRLHRQYPVEEIVGAMADLVRAGKVRAIGLPECSPEILRRAHAVWPLAAIEAEYSLASRNIEGSGLSAVLGELGIGLIAYSPLGRGMLARPIAKSDLAANDIRLKFPRFRAENLDRNQEIAARIAALATERGCTSTQLLLAWILAKAPDVVPIPGSRSEDHLEANAGAAELDLHAEDIELLETIVCEETVAGARSPQEWAN